MKNLFLSLFLAFSLPLCLPAQERPEWKILCPRNAAKVYRHAADEFRDFYRAVTGRELEIVQEPVVWARAPASGWTGACSASASKFSYNIAG